MATVDRTIEDWEREAHPPEPWETADEPEPWETPQAKVPAKIGRPPVYTQQDKADILERIAGGATLTKICAEPGQPHIQTVMKWVREEPDFERAWELALHCRRTVWADEIVDVSVTQEPAEKVTVEEGDAVVNGAVVPTCKVRTVTEDATEHRRLKISTKQWFLERTDRRFASKSLQESTVKMQVSEVRYTVVRSPVPLENEP